MMKLAPRCALLSLSLAVVACATGQDLAEEAAAIVEVDAGPPASSIRVDAAPSTQLTATPDAAHDSGDSGASAKDAASQADAAPPPPPPPVTAACPSSDGVLVIALLLAGTPPPACNASACSTGECCYNNQYCLPH